MKTDVEDLSQWWGDNHNEQPLSQRTALRPVQKPKSGRIMRRSSVLMSMVAANGIVTIPEELGGFEAGQTIDVSMIAEILS